MAFGKDFHLPEKSAPLVNYAEDRPKRIGNF